VQQPCTLRRDRVKQVGHGRARRGPLGLADRFQGSGRIAFGVPDPGQRCQAGGQRLGPVHLPTACDALGHVAEGSIKLTPLVGHLGHAHISDAGCGQRCLARRRGDLQRLLISGERRVQPALGALDLTKEMAGRRGQGTLTGRVPSGDDCGEAALGVCEPAAQPLGQGPHRPNPQVQHPVALAKFGQRLRREPGRTLGVATQVSEEGVIERDRRRDVCQHAGRPAGRRLERLVGRVRGRAPGGMVRRPGRVHVAAHQGNPRLRQAQPWAGPDQAGGQPGKPPLHRRALALQEDPVEVLLDEPRSPDRVRCAQGVAHGIIGETMLFRPGGRGPVQRRDPAGLLLLQAGAEQVGEQVVVAPPAAHFVQWHQEQVGPLHLLQHYLAIGAAGDRIAQPAGQPLQD